MSFAESPADALMWAVVASSSAWLVLSTVIPATLRGIVAIGDRVQILSRPIATVVAAVLLIGVVRISPTTATVPPPSERVIVEDQRFTGAVVVRNPVSDMVSSTTTGSTYTVMGGDTLWGIARHILDLAGMTPTGAQISKAWQEIYATNTDVVGVDPNLIFPGQVLTIPGGIHG